MKSKKIVTGGAALCAAAGLLVGLSGCSNSSDGNPSPPSQAQHARDIQNNPNIPPSMKEKYFQSVQQQQNIQKASAHPLPAGSSK